MVLADGNIDGAFFDVATNLIAAAIGGIVVWAVSRVLKRVRLLRARKFWKAMGGRKPLLVLGAPNVEPFSTWEKSGMVGRGDILALVEIESQLRRLGFAGTLVESKEIKSKDLRSDLILIGGPDWNSVTARMLGRLDGEISYAFVRDSELGVGVKNEKSGKSVVPQYDDKGDPTSDFGLIIRAANPLAPETAEIVILAGCWGYGTAAAAEKLNDRKFLRRQRKARYFEALVETTVVLGAHYNTKVIETRELSAE
jgi:hypothetical protein